MLQEEKIMTMDSRIVKIEAEQANVKDSISRLIESQSKTTAELSRHTTAVMRMTDKFESVSEERKSDRAKIDKLSDLMADHISAYREDSKIQAVAMEKLNARIDANVMTKEKFIGLLVLSAIAIFSLVAGAIRVIGG